jgi:hypothetical protein
MTEEEAEGLLSLLQHGQNGLEAFLGLPPDDRGEIMALLEQQAWAAELRQILEQCEADGIMDRIRELIAEQRTRRKEE